MTIGLTWFHPIVGVDIHYVMVPTPGGPVPTPLPHPFTGIVFDPIGLAVSSAIGSVVSAATGAPPRGPVLINKLPAANTGTDGTNKPVMPHFPTPPGVAWAPVPAGIKPPIPGKPPDPGIPAPVPTNDETLITGSKTVYISGTNACRLGDLSLSCGEPVRLPSSTAIAFPWAAPVMIGGPPALDFTTAALGMIRTKWLSDRMRTVTNRVFGEGSKAARWASRVVCFLTGHPVDVISGMVITEAVDAELPGYVPFRFERVYYSRSDEAGPLGMGWTHGYDQWVRIETDRIVYRAGDGREVYFRPLDDYGHSVNAVENLNLRSRGDWLEIEDLDGFRQRFERIDPDDGRWRLTAIVDRRGQGIEFRYDAAGRLHQATDSVGRLIGFEHDDRDRLTVLTLPHPTAAGERCTAARYEYDAAGDLIAVHDALGQTQRFEYRHHLLVRETDRNGYSFHFAYDGVTPAARCVRTWGDGGLYDHVLTYDSEQRITVKEDSYGATTVFHGNEAGLVTKIVDSLGRERRFEFDEALRTVRELDGSGQALTMEYDAAGRLRRIIDADGVSREFGYDAAGNEILSVDGQGTAYSHRYNDFGELLDSLNPLDGGFSHDYDEHGNLRRIRSRSGRTLRLAWDRQGNLAGVAPPGEPPLRLEHDALGRVAAVTFPDGNTVHYQRDLSGLTLATRDARLGEFRYTHDGVGNQTSVSDPGGGELRLEYGQFNKLLSATDSRRGTRRFEYDKEGDLLAIVNELGERCEYRRNSEGEVVEIRDFAGRVTKFDYDAAGNIIAIAEPGGRRRLGWTPGGRLASVDYPDGGFERYGYDANGRLVAIENESGRLERAFDAIGRLTGETWSGYTLRHEFDLDDQRIRTTDPDGGTLDYRYDAGGRLSALTVDERWQIGREYNEPGLPVLTRLPGGHGERRSYDAHGQLFEQRIDQAGGRLVNGRQYQFDAAGDPLAVFDRQRGATGYRFGVHGLEDVVRDGETLEQYRHDAAGHRLRADRPTEYGPGGRLLRQGDLNYVYDDAGRVIERRIGEDRWRFRYNARGQLILSIAPDGSETRYAYDPLGRRVAKIGERCEVHWQWLDGRIYRERRLENGRESITRYVFEPDTAIPLAVVQDGRWFSLISDPIGTPLEALSEQGELAWAGDFEAFGALRREIVAGFDNPLRLPGQYRDDETGLHYNHHRYYDPLTARYLTPDPWGVNGGIDLYGYPNNPLAWADPLGLEAGCVRRFMSSYKVFLQSGIRPKHARAIMRVASREGVEAGFRNIRWWKRAQSAVAGMLGVPPKPLPVKGKVHWHGTVTDGAGTRYRSDYDPTFFRKDGKVLSNDEALALNQKINKEIGSDEIQHGTHLTMDQAGVPPDKIKQIGTPGDSTVFMPDGTTRQVKDSDMIADPTLPWLW